MADRKMSINSAKAGYVVPAHIGNSFSPDEVDSFKESFAVFDSDGSGKIDASELSSVLKQLGEESSPEKVEMLIKQVDANSDGEVSFPEFLEIIQNSRGTDFADVVQKANKMYKVGGAISTSHHSFSEEEKAAFSEHINMSHENDPALKHVLPIDVDSMDLFSAVSDGLILAKMINAVEQDTIDERALNIPCKNPWHKGENLNLVVNAAKAIGCVMTNIGSDDLMKGKEVLILGLIWQIVKLQLMGDISLAHCPFLMRLLQEGEELSDLQNLPAEQLLLRWFNYHLAEAGTDRRVKNFGKDLKDGEAYSILLHQLSPSKCDLCNESDPKAKAAHVIANAKKLGVPAFIHAGDIVAGNQKLNLAFVAQIFNTCPGLTATETEAEEIANAFADMMDDDDGDNREERVFRMWLNSLGLDDVYINYLFDGSLADGLVILKAMDKIEPGIVHWKKVNLKTPITIKFKRIENCNYAVTLGKSMQFSLVNVGGVDIEEGNHKLILSIIWQLMRYHTIKILTEISGTGKKISDPDIVAWANNKVANAGFSTKIRNFKDKSIGDGVFLNDLLSAMKPESVNRDLIMGGRDDEEKKNNARYAISVARKIGATVFLTWEDVVEVKSKMVMTFVGCLMAVDQRGGPEPRTRALSDALAGQVSKSAGGGNARVSVAAGTGLAEQMAAEAVAAEMAEAEAAAAEKIAAFESQAADEIASADAAAAGAAVAAAAAPAAPEPVAEEPKVLSGQAEKQTLTDGISLLTTKNGDDGFTYQLENVSPMNIIFTLDCAGSKNLEMTTGGLSKDTNINSGQTLEVGQIKRVDAGQGYSLRMNMGLQQV
jgi:plastin-1